jgi:hypothetical protein
MQPSNPIKETIYLVQDTRTFKLSEFLELIEKEVQTIPEEFRKSTLIRFDAANSRNGLYPNVTICYFRPETVIEIQKQQLDQARTEKQTLNQELAEYKRLMKKFKNRDF